MLNQKYKTLVHIDSHLPCKSNENTSDIVVCYCLNDFTKKNGATRIWPKSNLSGVRIQNDKNYVKKINKKYNYVEAKKEQLYFLEGKLGTKLEKT